MPRAITRIVDNRAIHYWDGNGIYAKKYSELFNLKDRPAWDIYMIYGPEAQWNEKIPQPDYWMHQLEQLPQDKFLDGEKFAQAVRAILKK